MDKDLINNFNGLFSNKGWIYHSFLNEDDLRTAIKIFEEKGIVKAENFLIQKHEAIIMKKFESIVLSNIINVRNEIFLLAFDDFVADRYHSSVPLMLIAIDGTFHEIKSSYFSDKSNEFNIIDILRNEKKEYENILKMYTKSRQKSNGQKLEVVYRNGILHGRDYAYNNKKIAVKTFIFLFIIYDWLKILDKNKEILY